MKTLFRKYIPIAKILLLAIVFAASPAMAQQIKPSSSGYAPVNGIKVYYEIYGVGRPLILLHGAFYNIGMNWAELIPGLSKNRQVIALEMQGHGHSPFSKRTLSIATLASDVKGVMDYLKIDSADVAGFSMGGSIAYQFAVQNPARLKKLVIISSTYKSSGWLPEVNKGLDNLKPEIFNGSPLQTGYYAVAPDTSKWIPYVRQMLVFAGVPFNVGDANIAKIKAPVLLISGDNDGLDKIELVKAYKLLGGGIAADMAPMPKSQLAIVPAQGHVSLMMQTQTILNYLEGFLQ